MSLSSSTRGRDSVTYSVKRSRSGRDVVFKKKRGRIKVLPPLIPPLFELHMNRNLVNGFFK